MGAQLRQSQSDSLSMIFIVRSMLSLERKMKGGGRRKWGNDRRRERRKEGQKTGTVAGVEDPRQGRKLQLELGLQEMSEGWSGSSS